MSPANRAAHDDDGIQLDLADTQLRFRSLGGARVVDLGISIVSRKEL
jgi:hypothetical protein